MHLERQLEFDAIKQQWMDLAVTEAAKEKINGFTILLSESDLRKQMKDTTDGRRLMEQLGMPPLQRVEEIKSALQCATKGDCLTAYQLERVEKALVAMRRLKQYLARGRQYGNALSFYEENLQVPEELEEDIAHQIRNGEVDDYATKELQQIRGQMITCEEKMRQRAEQIIHSHRICMADLYCTSRNGRICVPVKKECRQKVTGTVIDRSATGNTLFIEPAGVSKYYEELQSLKIREEDEVYRILYTLSVIVAAQANTIEENIALMEQLDFILSKAKLSLDMDAVEPEINTERRICLRDARHPLMEREVNVPLQFEMGGDTRGIIITGPNTGGKTVAIKTVMLICMMAQCGLHVPCLEAEVCMNNAYLCDIGDGQNMAENLSTFSAHIKNVLAVLECIGRDSFVIMDELGSGTDPTEGMGIAVAVLEELRRSGANFLVTTHYPEVKEYAENSVGIVNARMTFDKETLRPTYQMVIGEAGESCAFYIADRLGMPNELLRTAIKAAYGEEAAGSYQFQKKEKQSKRNTSRISKVRPQKHGEGLRTKYKRGDSVMVYPDKKIGIVCEPINEKGVLRVQMPNRKIWINHKRVKLHVAADALYPEGYDFSILFDSVADRKIRHDMERKYTEEVIRHED